MTYSYIVFVTAYRWGINCVNNSHLNLRLINICSGNKISHFILVKGESRTFPNSDLFFNLYFSSDIKATGIVWNIYLFQQELSYICFTKRHNIKIKIRARLVVLCTSISELPHLKLWVQSLAPHTQKIKRIVRVNFFKIPLLGPAWFR